MKQHRWSGWPGAYCLDCGCEDPEENALAVGNYEEILDKNGNIVAFQFHFDPKLLECPRGETEQ